MRFQAAQWLLPLSVCIHNAEEAIRMPAFWQQLHWNPPVSRRHLWLAMLALDLLAVLLTYFAVKHGRHSVTGHLYMGFVFVLLLNVMWHVGVMIWYGTYATGVVTAVIFNLPLTVYLLRRAGRERENG